MKESYVEGLANHGGPESCVCSGNAVGEALTGESVGWVLSREITTRRASAGIDRSAEVVTPHRRQHWEHRIGEVLPVLPSMWRHHLWTPRGLRPQARMDILCTGTGRSHRLLRPLGRALAQRAS